MRKMLKPENRADIFDSWRGVATFIVCEISSPLFIHCCDKLILLGVGWLVGCVSKIHPPPTEWNVIFTTVRGFIRTALHKRKTRLQGGCWGAEEGFSTKIISVQ